MIVTAGKTNVSLYFYIVGDASHASPGDPITGLLFSDIETGGSASYNRQGAARVDLTLITLTGAAAAHADGGFILVDDTNMPGVYRCDFPDAAWATGVDQTICSLVVAAANNAAVAPILVDISDFDLRDAVRGGLTALPNAAADAAGGLAISDAGGLDLDTKLGFLTGDAFARLATYRLGELMSAALASQPFATSLLGDLTQDNPDAAGTQQFTVAALMRLADEALTGATHNIANSWGKRVRQIDAAFEVHSGTAQAGSTSTTIILDTGADSANNDIYRGDRCIIVGGTGIGEHDIIISYVASTRVATMAETWIVTPDNTSEFILVPASVDVETWQHNVVTSSASGLPDVNVNEVGDTSQTAGDIAALVTTVDTVVDGIQTDLDNATDGLGAIKTDTAATLVDTAVIGVAGAGLTDLGGMSTGMKAEVNTEADTALTDYDPPTNAEMEARTPTAAQLAYIVSNSADGLPCTFTGGTTTTAILGNVDGVAASATDDVYNGRILVFNAGTLDQQVTDITDYDGGTTTATITAVTTAVTSSHTANMK